MNALAPFGPRDNSRLFSIAMVVTRNSLKLAVILCSFLAPAYAQTLATMASPANGATNVDPGAPFSWNTVASAQAYYVYVGSAKGLQDVYGSGALSSSVSSIPLVPNLKVNTMYYVRLWTQINNCWCSNFVDSTFTTGYGTSHLTSPLNGATNVDPFSTFIWTSVPIASSYTLNIGTAPGASDVFTTGPVSVTSTTVPGLQANVTYYATVITQINDSSTSASTSFTTGTGLAHLIAPANGATNVPANQVFSWNAVSNAQSYVLYIGTSLGAKDIGASLASLSTTATFKGMAGLTLYYARLWTQKGGSWFYLDTTFTTAPSYATVIFPPNGGTDVDTNLTASWTSGTGAQSYSVNVGSTPGGSDIYSSGPINSNSVAIPGLQASTLYYLRIFTNTSQGSQSTDSSFTTFSPSSGHYSPVVSWPYIMTHAMLLPTGKVLWWPSWNDGVSPMLFDPIANTNTALPQPGYNIFCAGHAILPNGQVLVTGGHIASDDGFPYASAFDPGTLSWTQLPDMNAGRWYPTNTILPSGDMLVTSGDISPTLGNDTLPQVWQTATGTWRNLTTAQLGLPTYPEMYNAPDGTIFYAGPTVNTRFLNTTGTGSWSLGPVSNFGTRDYGPSVTYDQGKIMVMGGGNPPTATVEGINLSAPSPSWTYLAPMANPRRQANATVLPDGTVLVTGGSSGSGFDDATHPVYAAELYNPSTNTWTSLDNLSVYRGYHSIALLLPDGRVLSGGGNVPSAEIYSPPYLYKGSRPTITSAPSTISWNQSFFVGTPNATSINRVTLIRLPSTTHTFNENQAVAFPAFSQATGGLNVTTPSNQNVLPPGDYMLFLVNSTGVPSVASIVRVLSGTTQAPGISVSPTSLTFATQSVGTTSAPQTVTVSNVGNNPVSFNAASMLGSGFQVTNGCTGSLAPGLACNVVVSFQPVTGGAISASYILNDSDSSSPQIISLSGTASGLKFAPTSLTFAGANLGVLSTSKLPVTVTNFNQSAVSLNSFVYSDSEFQQDPTTTCTNSLAANASCTIVTNFTPNAGGTRTGTLTVSDSDPSSPTTISLVGTGLVPALMKLSATSFNLGTSTLGTRSSAKATLTLTNTGVAPIDFSSFTYSDPEFSEDASSTCGSSLAGLSSCIVYSVFTPNTIGPRTSTLVITDSDGSSPSTITLNGVGTEVKFTPTGLGFGSSAVNHTSPPLNLVVANLSTSATLNFASIVLGGANPGDFAMLSNNCGVSLTPGGTCTISFNFTPTAIGARSATLTFTDDGGASPQVVKLNGTGTAALVSITVTPTNPTISAGTTQQFTATGTYSDNSTKTLSPNWTSSSKAVATINSSGLATAAGVGSTTITANSGGIKGTTTLLVQN
jgi:hypothetical protein